MSVEGVSIASYWAYFPSTRQYTGTEASHRELGMALDANEVMTSTESVANENVAARKRQQASENRKECDSRGRHRQCEEESERSRQRAEQQASSDASQTQSSNHDRKGGFIDTVA